MSRAAEDWPPMTSGMAQAALIVVDHTPAILAYWDDLCAVASRMPPISSGWGSRAKRRWAHIADVTPIKALEASLREANAALQHSLDQMRELRAIVPICVYCKSVRTDENYWQQVETYIRRFTTAQFSHGICPQCYEKAARELLP